MELKIYKNINECGKLWNNFSLNERLFDSWAFRLCFYNRYGVQPYFIAGKEKGKIVGVIPLSFIKNEDHYTYFGGWFPERNAFFLKDKALLSQFLERCPDNTLVEGIATEESKYYQFLEDESTFYVDLLKYDNCFEKYFSSFNAKKQKNFRRDIKSIPKYRIRMNRLGDFRRLIELNIKQFDEESIYNDKKTRDSIYKMVKLAHKRNILQMISVEINGKTEAVDIGIIFGKWYHVITGSSNNKKIPNLGKLMTILNIQNATTKKCRYVDFLASSAYWKNQWNFESEMLYKFIK